MSLVSFNLFVGGGVGTFVNGKVLMVEGYRTVFFLAAFLILLAGIMGSALLRRLALAAPPLATSQALNTDWK
jgi:Na+-transporting methylmalonyl-CoA/oxaloacetate decarboxylase gamma subunit